MSLLGVIGMSSLLARASSTQHSAVSVRLAVVTAASPMADAQHDGPWGEEQIMAAVLAKSEGTLGVTTTLR